MVWLGISSFNLSNMNEKMVELGKAFLFKRGTPALQERFFFRSESILELCHIWWQITQYLECHDFVMPQHIYHISG